EKWPCVAGRTQESNIYSEPCGLALKGRALFPVTDQEQGALPPALAQLAKRLEQISVALVDLEVRDAQQHWVCRLDAGRSVVGKGGICEAVVDNGDLLRGYPLLRAGVIGHGLGVRDQQVGYPCS